MIRPLVARLAAPLRWHRSNKVHRAEVVQRCIDALDARRYLEIGVSTGELFLRVEVGEKIGVDPVAAGPQVAAECRRPGVHYHQLPSDEFFRNVAPEQLSGGIDVAFIDGLHTWEQAYRDCVNALQYLTAGGIILMHDCLPTSETEARVASSYEEAGRLNGPCWNGDWTGDVWKAIVMLRAAHPELETLVLDTDHGVGVVWRQENSSGVQLSRDQVERLAFGDLQRDAGRLLGLKRPHEISAVLRTNQRRRARS